MISHSNVNENSWFFWIILESSGLSDSPSWAPGAASPGSQTAGNTNRYEKMYGSCEHITENSELSETTNLWVSLPNFQESRAIMILLISDDFFFARSTTGTSRSEILKISKIFGNFEISDLSKKNKICVITKIIKI